MSTEPKRRVHRPLIMGRRGAVASNHPAATQAGLDVLRAGGNAADAAVAVSLALGVAEPHMSGLGGDGFYHVWMDGPRRSRVFNGTGPAPARSGSIGRDGKGVPVHGPLSVSTPGALAGLHAMHAACGTRPWAALCAPAIELAQRGVEVTHTYRHFAANALAVLRADPISRKVFLHDGEVPALGSIVAQPRLAETLEAVAADGAEGFYRGALARHLGGASAAAGSHLHAEDLHAMEAEEQAPLSIAYRGYEVRQTPPNSTGFVLLQELKIVENFDLAALGEDSAELVHLLVEAKKLAFLDRERHGADPRHVQAPMERLLSDEYAAGLARRIDRDRAADLPLTAARNDGDTTYFCVADGEGNVVSAIQSINSAFGSGVTAGETGVLLNNRMAYWHLDEGHPNALVPGKRVRHTMNAPMLFRGGRPWAVLGTPGADNQVQVNLQAITRLVDFGYDPQQAVEAPRWTSSQPGQGANWPHAGDGSLTIEADFPAATLDGLRAKGHALTVVPPMEGTCSLQCIRILDNGVRMAGSDPRRDGWAGAF